MTDAELIRLADIVINKIRPNANMRADMHQSALLAGWQALTHKRQDKPINRGYLYLCMATAAWRCLKKEQRHQHTEIIIDPACHDPEPEVMGLLDETCLTSYERKLLHMRYVGRRTIRQMAAMLRVPRSTCHYQIRRALNKLRKVIE